MFIDFLAVCYGRCAAPTSSLCPIFPAFAVLCIFILQPLKWCQSRPASCNMRVCLLCHFGVSVSLLIPHCWRARQAVPIKRAQGGLLWQQLLWCAVLSVCVCVCAVSWPCRADRPSSHGAGSSCVLCCRSGSLSH